MKRGVFLWLLLVHTATQAQQWQLRLDNALAHATPEKDVLLLFSVPENCNSCMLLEKNVLQSEAFLSYAQDNFVLARQEFKPENIEENLLVVEKYNKDGFFPLVVLINKSGRIVGQLGTYNNETPAEYIKKLQSVRKSQ